MFKKKNQLDITAEGRQEFNDIDITKILIEVYRNHKGKTSIELKVILVIATVGITIVIGNMIISTFI